MKYTKEQLWKLYENLPQDLKNAIFSEETANDIWNICTRNGIEEEDISEIAKAVGDVFLGITSPKELKSVLEREIKLSKEKAEKVFIEINRFILSSVKRSLSELYDMEYPAESKEEEKKPPKKDVYREPVEIE